MKEIACFEFTPDGKTLNVGDLGEKNNVAPENIEISANNFRREDLPKDLKQKLDEGFGKRVTDYALNLKAREMESTDRANLE